MPIRSKAEEQSFRAAILISAYGSSPYLASQIKSIIPQMTSDDILVVVDDGSRMVNWDPLSNINVNYQIWTRLKGMGSTRSYLELLIDHDLTARYYFLADQDDLWMPRKLETQINQFLNESAESIFCCLHAWENFNENRKSDRIQKMLPAIMLSKEHYCFETPAPGMTFCVAAKGKEILAEKKAIFFDYQNYLPHDRIICAVLARFSKIVMHPDVLVRYRQHDNNQIGAPNSNVFMKWLRRFNKAKLRVTSVRKGFDLAFHLYGVPERRLIQYKIDIMRSRLRENWFDNILVKLIILTSI